jgi:hypothetical protein
MRELVILRPVRAGALAEAKGAFVEVETNEGPRQLRFTYEDAERLLAALHEARTALHAERARSGKPPLAEGRAPQGWETAINPIEQTAVLRTHFSDRTTEETQIPRRELARIARFLNEALTRFETSADMRQ